ncbi:unannotated protein [freshwater metagenome]|uniref:Unannotated protein n=1 Tax=freshwater metagenome TaxID=449393 RepID=A0A6J7HMI5_9ZZZZ
MIAALLLCMAQNGAGIAAAPRRNSSAWESTLIIGT